MTGGCGLQRTVDVNAAEQLRNVDAVDLQRILGVVGDRDVGADRRVERAGALDLIAVNVDLAGLRGEGRDVDDLDGALSRAQTSRRWQHGWDVNPSASSHSPRSWATSCPWMDVTSCWSKVDLAVDGRIVFDRGNRGEAVRGSEGRGIREIERRAGPLYCHRLPFASSTVLPVTSAALLKLVLGRECRRVLQRRLHRQVGVELLHQRLIFGDQPGLLVLGFQRPGERRAAVAEQSL